MSERRVEREGSDLALPHYDARDVSAITDIPYMVVSHDLGQWHIALSQLENALPRVVVVVVVNDYSVII